MREALAELATMEVPYWFAAVSMALLYGGGYLVGRITQREVDEAVNDPTLDQ